ncbi:hypothetical protein BC830DRAFT_277038 [Chytriomyces sp. MP71]|nr:hypothetical protein BC830DRAFT_277038 [Chytriomyces sp. MP71]
MSQPLDVTNIKGIQPKKLFADGEAIEEFGYKQKRTHDHYYCTCPAWRMNGKPVDARTCKHLKAILGEEYEAARLKWKNPHGEVPKSAATKTNRAKKAASSASDDDDADDAATKFSAKKRAKREETKAKQPALLLADKWDEAKTDPTGWWVSEKLDGVRALWDHERGEFVSRLGNVFTAPDWFKDTMPEKESLDGELFVGRGKFSETVSVVKTINSPHWKKITYQVFDSPTMSKLPFEDRIARLKALYPPDQTPTVHIVAQENCKDKAHVLQLLREVEAKGGEGLMLRQPRSLYVGKRSATLLKVKSFYDAEAVVIGYEAGKGKNNGVVGSLKCRMACGKEFKVGTGLSDAERSKPPKVGVIVTYRFQELTLDGVPRFPSFVGERLDADKPKDAVVRVVNTKD